MNISIQGQIVNLEANILGYELDNLIDTINLTILNNDGEPDITPTEQQWEYSLILYMVQSQSYQTITFNGTYPNFNAILTSEQLPTSGRYIGQFKMELGEQIGYTQQFSFWVEDTLNSNTIIENGGNL